MSGRLTSAGLNRLLNYGVSTTGFAYLQLGTGYQAFSVGLTALNAYLLGKANDIIKAQTMADLVSYLTNSEGNSLLSEVGLSTAASAGTLLGYEPLPVAVSKDSSRPLSMNWVQSVQNLKTHGFFTAYGLKAIAAGGCSTTTLPYLGVGSGKVPFHEYMADAGTEIQRIATAHVTVTGAGVVIDASFSTSQGNGTWESIRLWDAASGGNLLAYVKLASPYVKTSAAGRVAKIAFTLANEV